MLWGGNAFPRWARGWVGWGGGMLCVFACLEKCVFACLEECVFPNQTRRAGARRGVLAAPKTCPGGPLKPPPDPHTQVPGVTKKGPWGEEKAPPWGDGFAAWEASKRPPGRTPESPPGHPTPNPAGTKQTPPWGAPKGSLGGSKRLPGRLKKAP